MGKNVKIENIEIPEIKKSNGFVYLCFSLGAIGVSYFLFKKLKNRGGLSGNSGKSAGGASSYRAGESVVS